MGYCYRSRLGDEGGLDIGLKKLPIREGYMGYG